ncbi:hypothetical protein ACTVZO_27900 [Streptomyces sp. IBSNAI002]|uniref:hypothetical protein n=1 Tax=Streptomyces sp. IBSNAI002 TaxID=3457500 RepID=UPI003FD58DF6
MPPTFNRIALQILGRAAEDLQELLGTPCTGIVNEANTLRTLALQVVDSEKNEASPIKEKVDNCENIARGLDQIVTTLGEVQDSVLRLIYDVLHSEQWSPDISFDTLEQCSKVFWYHGDWVHATAGHLAKCMDSMLANIDSYTQDLTGSRVNRSYPHDEAIRALQLRVSQHLTDLCASSDVLLEGFAGALDRAAGREGLGGRFAVKRSEQELRDLASNAGFASVPLTQEEDGRWIYDLTAETRPQANQWAAAENLKMNPYFHGTNRGAADSITRPTDRGGGFRASSGVLGRGVYQTPDYKVAATYASDPNVGSGIYANSGAGPILVSRFKAGLVLELYADAPNTAARFEPLRPRSLPSPAPEDTTVYGWHAWACTQGYKAIQFYGNEGKHHFLVLQPDMLDIVGRIDIDKPYHPNHDLVLRRKKGASQEIAQKLMKVSEKSRRSSRKATRNFLLSLSESGSSLSNSQIEEEGAGVPMQSAYRGELNEGKTDIQAAAARGKAAEGRVATLYLGEAERVEKRARRGEVPRFKRGGDGDFSVEEYIVDSKGKDYAAGKYMWVADPGTANLYIVEYGFQVDIFEGEKKVDSFFRGASGSEDLDALVTELKREGIDWYVRVTHHSTALGGGGVIACGDIIIGEGGVIEHLDHRSGHYRPTSLDMYRSAASLQDAGFDLTGADISLYAVDGDKNVVRKTTKKGSQYLGTGLWRHPRNGPDGPPDGERPAYMDTPGADAEMIAAKDRVIKTLRTFFKTYFEHQKTGAVKTKKRRKGDIGFESDVRIRWGKVKRLMEETKRLDPQECEKRWRSFLASDDGKELAPFVISWDETTGIPVLLYSVPPERSEPSNRLLHEDEDFRSTSYYSGESDDSEEESSSPLKGTPRPAGKPEDPPYTYAT